VLILFGPLFILGLGLVLSESHAFGLRFNYPRADFDLAILSEFYRVGEQVHRNLLNALLVANDDAAWGINLQHDVFAGSLHIDDASNLLDGLLELATDRLCGKSTSLDLSVVKSVIDIVKHENTGELDDLQVLALHEVLLLRKKQISKVDRRAKGCPHLVRDIC